MDANILCKLLAARITPEKFQLWGTEVHWLDKADDTPEHRAIVEYIIANYDSLLADYQAGEEKAAKERAVKEILAEIDEKSIRVIREWIVTQPLAPQLVKDYETQASTERSKLE